MDEFYDQRAFGADTDLPDSDVIMMQAGGKGISMRPGHRKGASAGKEPDAAHPGIKKMAEIVAVADFTPAVREPEDIAALPARRKERPGPQARDKWVAASVTETIEDMIGVAFNEADRRDPERVRQRVFLVDGNKQQLSAIAAHAHERGLKVPVFIDFIHVSGDCFGAAVQHAQFLPVGPHLPGGPRVAGVQRGCGLAEVAADMDEIDEHRHFQAAFVRVGGDGGQLLLVPVHQEHPLPDPLRIPRGSASLNATPIMSSMVSVTDAATHLSLACGPGRSLRRAGGAAMSSGSRTAGVVSRRRRRSRPSS